MGFSRSEKALSVLGGGAASGASVEGGFPGIGLIPEE